MRGAFEDCMGYSEQQLIIRLSKEELDAQIAEGIIGLPDGAQFRIGTEGYSEREIWATETTNSEMQAVDPNDRLILGWLSLAGATEERKALGRSLMPDGPIQKVGRLLGKTVRHQFTVSWRDAE